MMLLGACGDDAQSTGGDSSTSSSETTPSTGPSSGSLSAGPTTATTGPSPDTTGSTTDAPTGTSTEADTDVADSSSSTGGDTDVEPGVLPDPIGQSGVAYVPHFLSNELRWYRTDGETPTFEDSLDLGVFTHDAALDDVHDRLITAHDAAREVRLYALDRPTDADTPVAAPDLLAAIDMDTPPRFVRVDPYHDRIYVVADDAQQGTGMALLSIFDVSDPRAPQRLDTLTIPSTTSLDVDGARSLLVLFAGIPDELVVYDLSTARPTEVEGSPIDLRALYPQENQVSFSARSLVVDPWHNRIYAARPQGGNSELIALEYPAAVPGDGQAYDDVATFEVTAIEDPFDVDVPIADRPGILDAFTPMPSPADDLVFLLASAWNGTQATATLVTMLGADPLGLLPGCADHEEFGCFVRNYVDGNPINFARTDGAACRDRTHGVIVATALGSVEDDPGRVAMFRYDDEGATSVWLSADGDNLPAAPLPISAVCH